MVNTADLLEIMRQRFLSGQWSMLDCSPQCIQRIFVQNKGLLEDEFGESEFATLYRRAATECVTTSWKETRANEISSKGVFMMPLFLFLLFI